MKRAMVFGWALLAASAALVACGSGAATAVAPAAEEAAAPQAAESAQAAAPESGDAAQADQGAVEAVENSAAPEGGATCDGSLTPAQTEGPYYTPGSPEKGDMRADDPAGTPLVITGRVLDAACQPVGGAVVDFWQTDSAGNYDNAGYLMRGHVTTGADGSYRMLTVVPGEYPGRTAHIHVKVFDPSGAELLTTQLYLRGLSETVPDGIYDAALLATDLAPDAEGRRQVGFDFVVRGG